MAEREKVCGERASAHVWSRDELLTRAKAAFPDRAPTFFARKNKRELCALLHLPWVQRQDMVARRAVAITTDKTCTSRASRLYPHRYSRRELIDLIRSRPRCLYSTGTLMKMKLPQLCRLAHLPFVAVPRISRRPERAQTPADTRRRGPLVDLQHRDAAGQEETKSESCIQRSRLGLKPHQRRVIEYLRDHRGLIAVHALGSGKTLTAVVATQCYLDQHPRNKVLFVGPASLVSNFRKEMATYGGLRHEDRYILQSYEKFLTDSIAKRIHAQDCRRTMLVIDEGHNLRTVAKQIVNRRTGRTTQKGKKVRHLRECADFADRVLILTATPLVNHPMDIIPLLNMVRDHPTAENSLVEIKSKTAADTFFQDARNMEVYVRNKIHFFSPDDDPHRRYYPAVEYHPVYLKMNPSYLARYEEIESDMEEGMGQAVRDIFGREANLKPFLNGIRSINTLDTSPHEMSHSPKIKWIHNFLLDAAASSAPGALPRTLVFSQFLDMGSQAVIRRIPPAWRNVMAFIDGSVPKSRRAAIVEQYNSGAIRLLFISKAGGEGLDLKETKNVVIMETSWNEAAERQAIGRAVRFQSHTHLPFEDRVVHVYRLYLVKPVDAPHVDDLLLSRSFMNANGDRVSADMILRVYQLRKEDILQPFLQELRHYAL